MDSQEHSKTSEDAVNEQSVLSSSESKENQNDEQIQQQDEEAQKLEEQKILAEKQKIEEEKFKSKYPMYNNAGAGNTLLQKRLHRGQKAKFFDSGDYNMAKAKQSGKGVKKAIPGEKLLPQESTGHTIPTVENVPVRKTSINTHGRMTHGVS
ncbi:uncharacterized protein LOC141905328 [Tubulanus polymorphus]|uniref:uncharacterized protein LOC141905328 n=1 Tax=Tubulanus polymorphus TaxID=672921 RepID=UPI003DA6B864